MKQRAVNKFQNDKSKKSVKKRIGINKIIGHVNYYKNVESKFLELSRNVFVWLPPGYDQNNEKKYPVLYMHDGQNLINPKTSFAGYDWRVDETASKLIRQKKLHEIIIVGINNTKDRLEEYSSSNKGKSYVKFIIEELKPFIDSNYRTNSDKKNTAVMGSSMGGLISFFIVWNFPEVFSKAACLSSSFYYNNEEAIKMVHSVKGGSKAKKKIKLYIDHGEDGLPRGQKMFCALTKKNYLIGTDIDYYYAPGAEHNEIAWADRLERPLLFLFGRKDQD